MTDAAWTTLGSAVALTFASSVHCLGMCGGLSAAVQGAGGRGLRRLLLHQGLLHSGKTATYVFLGAAAGLAGERMATSSLLAGASRILAVAAGLALVAASLTLLGAGRSSGALAGWFAPALSRVVDPLLSRRPPGAALVVGLVMGLLPCPLVMAGLVAAAATTSPLGGALTLMGVGLGTVPALTAAALASLAGLAPPATETAERRRRWALAAGLVLLLAGGITLARGLVPGHAHGQHGPVPGTSEDKNHRHH